MTPPSRIKVLRVLRAALAIYLIGLIALDAADLIVFGHISAFIVAVPVFMLAVITLQTFVIRRDKVLNRPRPDYSAIATMEQELYGETFEHEGAPERRGGTGTTTVVYASGGLVAAGGGAGGTSGTKHGTCWHCGHLATRMDGLCDSCQGMLSLTSGHGISNPRSNLRSDHDRFARRLAEGPRHPDTTIPATIDQYVTWLRGYVKRGGKPTHFYDHPFKDFRYAASGTLVVESDHEYGANSREIIVARGVDTRRTNPADSFGGWAHTSLFFMHGYRTNATVIPVYSDPEFDQFRTTP